MKGRRGGETLDFEASLVVGDDGGSSVERTRLGIPIALHELPIEFLTATITRWPLEPRRGRVWVDPRGFRGDLPAAGLLPWPGGEGSSSSRSRRAAQNASSRNRPRRSGPRSRA